MPVVLTEHGSIPYDETTVQPYSQAPASNPTDPEEQRNDYQALLREADGRRLSAVSDGRLDSIHVWHWAMPGAEGSLWLLDPEGDAVTHGAGAAQLFVDFVGSAPAPVPLSRVWGVALALALLASGASRGWKHRTQRLSRTRS
jgi:hypothetical protein